MKKSLLIISICFSLIISLIPIQFSLADESLGMTKSQVENIFQNKIDDNEWNKLTNNGKIIIIGAGSAVTEMEIKEDVLRDGQVRINSTAGY